MLSKTHLDVFKILYEIRGKKGQEKGEETQFAQGNSNDTEYVYISTK